ncbi:MAG: hypothetical protein M0P70_11610 [Desulfobulbaceae bacterium]|nr:hypothetical protein [Desulfobulbaceae bacterium]
MKIVDVPPVGNLKKNPAKIRQAAQGSGLVETRQAILDLLLIRRHDVQHIHKMAAGLQKNKKLSFACWYGEVLPG